MDKIGITWLGTASVRIRTPNFTVISDPFIGLKGAEHPTCAEDFLGADMILITHAHLDHLASLPEILSLYSPRVCCTNCAAELLGKRDNVDIISCGDSFEAGDITVAVYKGKHIRFDRKLVMQTLSPLRLAKNIGNVPRLWYENIKYKENGETVFYEINTGGKRLQLMGSLALCEGVDYPVNADMLFLPYQGSSYLENAAQKVIERLLPKRITVTHFDNAFPPVSQTISTEGLLAMAAEKFPAIDVRVPVFGEEFFI